MADVFERLNTFPITLTFTVTDVIQAGPVDGVLAGVAATNGFVVPTGYKFVPVYIDAESNAARTAGLATVVVTADGTELVNGPEAVIDDTNTLRHQGTLALPGAPDSVAAGEEVGVSADGDASWTPETADFDVILCGYLVKA